jgi:hypothetical protein
MPLRMWPCGIRDGIDDISSFLVRERFLIFTHTVAVPFIEGGQIVTHFPAGKPGEPNTLCAAR